MQQIMISQKSICETGYTATKKEVVENEGIEMWNRMVSIAKLNSKGQSVIYVGNTYTSSSGAHFRFNVTKKYKDKEPVFTRPAPQNIIKILVYELEINDLGDTFTKEEFLKKTGGTEADWNYCVSIADNNGEVELPTYGGLTANDEGNIKRKLMDMLE